MGTEQRQGRNLDQVVAALTLLLLHSPRPGSANPAYRYWPVFDSVSIARLALAFLPVTRVRM